MRRASPMLPCAAVLAIAALWVVAPGGGEAAEWPRLPPQAELCATAAPAPAPPIRQSGAFVRDLQSMADVHVLRQQAAAAGSEAIPELRDLALTAKDPIAVGCALAALGRLGALADDDALLALLHDARPRVRQELVVALGHTAGPRAIATLHDAARGGDADLQPLAIAALGRIGGKAGTAALTALQAQGGLGAIAQACVRDALLRARDPGHGRRIRSFERQERSQLVLPQ